MLPESKLELLTEVVNTFVTVAASCGVAEYGVAQAQHVWEGLGQIVCTISITRQYRNEQPIELIIRCLESPFDAAHCIPDTIAHVGCTTAAPGSTKHTLKMLQLLLDSSTPPIQTQLLYFAWPKPVALGLCLYNGNTQVVAALTLNRYIVTKYYY